METALNNIQKELVDMAEDVMSLSYSKYSKFPVGASVITKNGDIYTGFNIENVSFGLTNCAERTALFHALASGEKPKDFKSIAIIANTPEPICPCGACLQVMAELGGPDLEIVMSNGKKDQFRIAKLKDLLPFAFSNTETLKPDTISSNKKLKTKP